MLMGEHNQEINKHKTGEGKGGVGWFWERGRVLLLVGRVPIEIVGHEENVWSRRDEGVARFHDLEAQETECTHQLGYRKKAHHWYMDLCSVCQFSIIVR